MCVSHGYRLTLLAHPDRQDRQAVSHCHTLAVSLSYTPKLLSYIQTHSKLNPERERNHAMAKHVVSEEKNWKVLMESPVNWTRWLIGVTIYPFVLLFY